MSHYFCWCVCDAVMCPLTEWLTADGQRTQLADEDATSRTVDGWRQINTLAHYGIHKIATMFLVQATDTSTTRTKKSVTSCECSY